MYWRGILSEYFLSNDNRISVFSGIIAITLFYLGSIYFRTYLELPAEIPERMPYLLPLLLVFSVLMLFLIPILKVNAKRAGSHVLWFGAKTAATLNVIVGIVLVRLIFVVTFSPYAVMREILADYVYYYSHSTTQGVINGIIYYAGSFIFYLLDILFLPLLTIPVIQFILYKMAMASTGKTQSTAQAK